MKGRHDLAVFKFVVFLSACTIVFVKFSYFLKPQAISRKEKNTLQHFEQSYKFRVRLVLRKVSKTLNLGPNIRLEVSKTIALSKYKTSCKKKNFAFGLFEYFLTAISKTFSVLKTSTLEFTLEFFCQHRRIFQTASFV